MNAVHVNFDLSQIPPEHLDELKNEAIRRGVPLAQILRDAAVELAKSIGSRDRKPVKTLPSSMAKNHESKNHIAQTTRDLCETSTDPR